MQEGSETCYAHKEPLGSSEVAVPTNRRASDRVRERELSPAATIRSAPFPEASLGPLRAESELTTMSRALMRLSSLDGGGPSSMMSRKKKNLT